MKIFALVIIAVLCTSSAYAYPITPPAGKTLKVHWALLQAKPGKMPEMLSISSRTVAKFTPNEPGSYALYGALDKTNTDLMRILEIYEDESAYQVHRASEGFRAFIEERKPILESLNILPVTPIVLEQKTEGTGTLAAMSLLEVNQESIAEFRELIAQEMTRAVRDVHGVLGMFATEEENGKIRTLEIYADEAARDEYLASEKYLSYRKKADELLTSQKDFESLPAKITLSRKGLHL